MDTETELETSISDELELIKLLTDKTLQQLKGVSSALPAGAVDGLKRLRRRLGEISRQITAHEEERSNLLALADIGQIVNSSLEINEALRIVMDTIISLTGAERGFLMLKDVEGNLNMRIARNLERETIASDEFEISRTIVNRVASDGKPVLTTNAQEDPRFVDQESIVAYNLRSILCVPLKVKDVLTGVIYAENRIQTGMFTEAERDLLAAFANQAAVAIDNARLFESVRKTLAEVTELKNLMGNVFASIASGVITSDINEKITLSNRAAEAILGWNDDEAVGKTLGDALPALAEYLDQYIASVRETDQPQLGLEFDTVLPDRGKVDLRFNLSPLKDADEDTQGVAIVLDDLTERKRLEAQQRLFERMVSPRVIDKLDPDTLSLGGERTEITTLFADIRGFTRFSEMLTPEELVSILNQYLSVIADAVLKQEGTIDKFLGDGMMAWFNAPIPQSDHTLRAVKAAIGIREAISELHKKLPEKSRLSCGVGIHFGEAVLGLVGTEKSFNYTAIGDSVNTAKRIQENTRENQILISEDALKIAGDEIEVREVEPVTAKGKSQPVIVYEVIGIKS